MLEQREQRLVEHDWRALDLERLGRVFAGDRRAVELRPEERERAVQALTEIEASPLTAVDADEAFEAVDERADAPARLFEARAERLADDSLEPSFAAANQ